MKQDIIEILNSPIENVIKDSKLSRKLMNCYSLLYLSGASPRFCEQSQRAYHKQLKIDGMSKALLLEQVEKRTLIPVNNSDRLVYNSRLMEHYRVSMLTDEKAIIGLAVGAFKETDFKTLPKGWDIAKSKFQKNTNSKTKINLALKANKEYLESLKEDTEKDKKESKKQTDNK